ncbi:glycoside hydrolase family 78 protein [Boeremia exigua]|uniref:glycoside hydrolase family 78 protein n=1 Tax=Boeremia exigua TaxID=749465 RepID=UPI001E8EAB83|nr:glycoside hydrolase family 78 protein [Boeremia exigua]KAH6614995.1 glycoside hydrolase family 78 protein [Boeremia exigua]
MRSSKPPSTGSTVQRPTGTIYGSNGTITLNGSSNTSGIALLDYGANFEGLPTFEVVSVSGDVSGFQIKYSETKSVLETNANSDGPVGLAAAMDSYRVNMYSNITGPTNHTNRLIQGGFRYQELRLITAGEMILRNVGVKPTTSTESIGSLPGSFECSDDKLNQIWNVGARTVQLNEIPANSIPLFWEVSSEGSYVESQAPQSYASPAAASLMNYVLEFDVKPVANGFSFSVLADTLNLGIYIWCNIANGTISANNGATEATSGFLASASLAANVTVGNWHKVQAIVDLSNISISIDGSEVLKFTQTVSFFGSFGLGAALNQSAIFKDLKAYAPDGTPIYSSELKDASFLPDFLMGTNPHPTTVDGSKRDRIAYAGDLDVSVGTTMVSTFGVEYIQGTLDLFAGYQATPGFFIPTVKIQQEPLPERLDISITGLIGYSFNLVCAVASFYQSTGNKTLALEWAPKIVEMLNWADSQTLPGNGLFNVSNPSFGGDWNYYDPVQAGVSAKFNTLYAYTLQSSLTLLADAGVNATQYSARLDALRIAINKHLWSNELGAYFLSNFVKDGFAQDSNAYAILAGVTNSNHTSQQVLASMGNLSTPYGPHAFSAGALDAGFRKLISPFASAYHLRAAFSAGNAAVAKELLRTLWGPMADPAGTNYTGCFWETLDTNGGPGLGDITSLCHAWGSGPTAELSTHVLGIRAVKPGYSEWLVSPITLGLSWARGKIPVPGGYIDVSWNATDDVVTRLEVTAPNGTMGMVQLPVGNTSCPTAWTLNGKPVDSESGQVSVAGGDVLIWEEEHKIQTGQDVPNECSVP